jgi:hypothetical protein
MTKNEDLKACRLPPVKERIPDYDTAIRCLKELRKNYDFSTEERVFREDCDFSIRILETLIGSMP